MSHFLYGHKDLTAEPNVWKVGKSLTPWSAVRLRQRHCWNTVGLDYLFFGRARHIDFLENQVKRHFEYRCGSSLVGNCRTELFKVPEQELFDYIRDQIKTHELHVSEMVLKEMYSATSAGQCPFGVPSEDTADHWCEQRVLEMWGKDPDEILREKLFVWEQ